MSLATKILIPILDNGISLQRPPVSDYTIWYRANGLVTGQTNIYGTVDSSGNVTQLTDLSSAKNNAVFVNGTGTAPTLAGTNGTLAKKGVTFDGITNNLQISNKALVNNVAGATVFIVCKTTAVVGGVTENEVFFLSGSGNDNGRFSLSVDVANSRWRTRCRRLDAYVYADSHELLGSTDILTSKVMAVNANYSTGLGLIYENGEIINWDPNLNTATGNTSATDSKYASIGCLLSNEGDGNFPFNGVISEIIFFPRALSTSECDSVNAYLQSFYGISSPADAPTQAPTTALLAKYTALGIAAPSANWIRCFNNYIYKSIANGNYAKRDAFGIFETESESASLIDIVDTTKAIVNSGATWSTRGFTGNGSSAVLNLWINLSSGTANYTRNSGCFIVYTRKNAVDAGVSGGCKDASGNVLKLYPRWTDGNAYSGVNEATGTHAQVTTYTAFGIFFAARTGANAASVKIGTEIAGTTAQASTPLPNAIPKLLGFNNNGTAAEWYNGQVSMYSIVSGTFDTVADNVDYKTFEAGIGILS